MRATNKGRAGSSPFFEVNMDMSLTLIILLLLIVILLAVGRGSV